MILPKMGINKHIQSVFRYAPKSLQGLELPNIYTEQGIFQIMHFLRHIGENTQDGKMITINLEAAQMQIRTSTHFFSLPFDDYECLLPICWVKSLWEFLWRHGITINGPIQTPTTCRRNDLNIIEQVVSNYPNIKQEDLTIFNNCRLFLQVHSLSDITTGNGKRIMGSSLQGIRDNDRKSNLIWPSQQRPSDRYWKIWRRIIRHTFTDNTYWSLKRSLGSWTKESHQEHHWYCDENMETLYFEHSPNSYRIYTREDGPRLRRSNKYRFSGWTDRIQTYHEKTTIHCTQNGHIRGEGSSPIIPSDRISEERSINSIIESKPQWIREILRVHEWPHDLTPFANSLQRGYREAIADGSYKKRNGLGTCAWMITLPDDSMECLGASQVPGDPEIMESYRSEIYGILSIIVFVDIISTFYNINDGHITIACDNIEAGKHSLLNWNKHSPKVKHFDLLWQTWKRRRTKNIKWTYKHAKGHRDRETRNLTKWEWRNIRMDSNAKRYMKHIESQPTYSPPNDFLTDQWEISCHGTKITGRIKKSLIEHIHGRALKHYYVRSGKLSARSISLINWNGIEKANSKLSSNERIWLTKFVSKFSATGRNTLRWNKWNHSKCPRCNQNNEDNLHVVMCPDEEVRENLYENISKIEDWMDKYDTHPAINHMFSTTLYDFGQSNFTDNALFILFDDESNIATIIKEAASDQDEIGWLNTFEGKLSKKWELAQDEHYRIVEETRKSGLTWTTWFIEKLYDTTKSQWTHRNEVLHHQTKQKNISTGNRTTEG